MGLFVGFFFLFLFFLTQMGKTFSCECDMKRIRQQDQPTNYPFHFSLSLFFYRLRLVLRSGFPACGELVSFSWSSVVVVDVVVSGGGGEVDVEGEEVVVVRLEELLCSTSRINSDARCSSS